MKHDVKNLARNITWKELRQADRTLSVPFQLSLEGSTEPLICDTVVRIVPGKRLVAFATWGDKVVVAKLFYEFGKAKKHLKRDVNGINSLVSAGVPTPKLLFTGSTQKKKLQVLLFERIIDAKGLDIYLRELTHPEDLLLLLRAVTIELATQHVVGIMQKDLHPKNFLIGENQIYTLDGGCITKSDTILPKEQSLDHLALFFAQLSIDTVKLQEKLFQIYAKARGWIIKPADLEFMRKATRKWTEKRWSRFSRKIERNCTAFARMQTASSVIMFDREYQTNELIDFLKNPESLMQHGDTEFLKEGRTSTVAKVKINQQYFVVKRYNIKSSWHWLRRCLRPTRAAAAWQLAQRLQLFGIHTPKPIAFIENRFLGLRGKSYFVMEFIDAPHLGEYSERMTDNNLISTIAQRTVDLFSHLAKLRLTHGDLKATNILIHRQRPTIIDLDGMEEHATAFGLRRAWRKEVDRFMRNWEQLPQIKAVFEKLISFKI